MGLKNLFGWGSTVHAAAPLAAPVTSPPRNRRPAAPPIPNPLPVAAPAEPATRSDRPDSPAPPRDILWGRISQTAEVCPLLGRCTPDFSKTYILGVTYDGIFRLSVAHHR